MRAQNMSGAGRDYDKRGKQGDQRGPDNNDRAVRMQSTAEILNFVAPGDIAHGTVAKVESFGAFIELDGCHGLHGLVHVSQMAKDRVDSATEVVATGDKVYVKVLSIEDGTGERPKPRVSLSMKYCSQSDGSDKDPNGILAEQEQRRKRTRREDPGPLELDAVYKTVCTKCGGQGHLAAECFNTGGSSYSLIAEDDQDYRRALGTDTHTDTGRGHEGQSTGLKLPPNTAPIGRGRGAVMPAWMTSKDPDLGGGVQFSNRDNMTRSEDRERHNKKRREREIEMAKGDKKDKKKRKKKEKKEKKEMKEKKEKKEKKKKHHHHKEHKKENDRLLSRPSPAVRFDDADEAQRHHHGWTSASCSQLSYPAGDRHKKSASRGRSSSPDSSSSSRDDSSSSSSSNSDTYSSPIDRRNQKRSRNRSRSRDRGREQR